MPTESTYASIVGVTTVPTQVVLTADDVLLRRRSGLHARPLRLLYEPDLLLQLAGRCAVVPVDGADLPANIGRLRRRLLAVPAIAAVEITPIEQTQ